MMLGLLLNIAGSTNAGIVNPGEYIGGDAQYVTWNHWNPIDQTSLFHADSSDGTTGWGTRAPRRTVNGHEMSPGGTHGLLSNVNDSGWINATGSNAGNPAGQTGSAWISYRFDDIYALGAMHIWNWNSPNNPGGGQYAGGIKDVKIDYFDGANWNHLGSFQFPQALGTANYAGVVGPDFAGASAELVVITVQNDWNHWTAGPSTLHGLGEVAFNIDTGPPIILTESGGSTDVNEEGSISDDYTIVLTSAPSNDVVIEMSYENFQIDVTPIQITFTSLNWAIEKTITVTAVDDLIEEGPHTSTITHTIDTIDPTFSGESIADVVVDITDRFIEPLIAVTESGGSTDVNEEGLTSDDYTIVLTSVPSDDVVIDISYETDQISVGPDSVTFNTLDWDTSRTITVTAVDDPLEEGPHTSTITHTVDTIDPEFSGESVADVVANIIDNNRVAWDLNAFRGSFPFPTTATGISSFEQIHGGFIFGGQSVEATETIPGIVHFMVGSPPPPNKYPDWAMKHPNGTPYPSSSTACFNSPYKDYVVTEAKDFVRDQPMAGLLLDEFWWGSGNGEWCCCDYCKQAYLDRFAQTMPLYESYPTWSNPQQMKQDVEWRADTMEALQQLCYDELKTIAPALLVSIHGARSSSIYQNAYTRLSHMRIGDFAFMESYHDEIFFASWLRGVSNRSTMRYAPFAKDTPFFAHPAISGYNDDYMNAVVSGMVAHGSRPIMYLRWTEDGMLSQSAITLMESVYQEAQQKEPFLVGASPILYAAIVYSEAVRTYYGRDIPDQGLRPHLEGIFDTLQRLRVPVEFISAAMDLDLSTLQMFKVVILPNVAILSPTQVQALNDYVQAGGSILATYETSLYDQYGNVQSNFDLASLFGLNYVEKRNTAWVGENAVGAGAYLAPRGNFLTHIQNLLDPVQDTSLHMTGPTIITESTAGVSRADLILAPETSQSVIPGVHLNNFGSGKSAYICAPLFKLTKLRAFDTTTHPPEVFRLAPFVRDEGWVVNMTRELLDELAPNPPIRVEGPHYLECTFFDQVAENRIIMHLLNSTVRVLGEANTMDPAKIVVIKDFADPTNAYSAWPELTSLEIQDMGQYLEINVPETRIHQIVVIER